MTKKQAEIQEGVEWFKKHVKPGDTLYTIIRSVSRSGMSRTIGLVVIKADKDGGDPAIYHPNYSAAKVTGFRLASGAVDGVKVSGCGMDMGFHLVYTLSQAVYGDGYAIKQRWL